MNVGCLRLHFLKKCRRKYYYFRKNMWHQKPLIIQLISQDFQNILVAKNGLNIN